MTRCVIQVVWLGVSLYKSNDLVSYSTGGIGQVCYDAAGIV